MNCVRGGCGHMIASASAAPLHHPMFGGRPYLAFGLGRGPSWRTASAQGQSQLINRAKGLAREAGSKPDAMNGAERIEVLESSRIQQHLRHPLPQLQGQDDLSESGPFRYPLNSLCCIWPGGAESTSVAAQIAGHESVLHLIHRCQPGLAGRIARGTVESFKSVAPTSPSGGIDQSGPEQSHRQPIATGLHEI